jgi:precorrin-6B methylase 2
MQLALSDADRRRLMRPVRGSGGFQSLLRTLQRRLRPDGTLTLDAATAERVMRYCTRYGSGGFQGRLLSLLH